MAAALALNSSEPDEIDDGNFGIASPRVVLTSERPRPNPVRRGTFTRSPPTSEPARAQPDAAETATTAEGHDVLARELGARPWPLAARRLAARGVEAGRRRYWHSSKVSGASAEGANPHLPLRLGARPIGGKHNVGAEFEPIPNHPQAPTPLLVTALDCRFLCTARRGVCWCGAAHSAERPAGRTR